MKYTYEIGRPIVRSRCDDIKMSACGVAGMLINFRSGNIPLLHDLFSKGHAEIFRETAMSPNSVALHNRAGENDHHERTDR